MLNGKLNPGALPPLSRSDHSVQTFCVWKLANSFATTVAVQFPGVQYPVPLSAASKNGCGATAAWVEATVALLHAVAEVAQPMAFSTAARGLELLSTLRHH